MLRRVSAKLCLPLIAALSFAMLPLAPSGVAAYAQVRTAVTFMGAWSSGTVYTWNDEVTFGSGLFVSLVANNTATPVAATTTANWQYIATTAAGGNQSSVTPSFTIGTVTALSSGATPTATITGTPPNFILNVGLPAGAAGAAGATGPPPTITIGTVTALSSGATPTATITGSGGNYTLNLGIPGGGGGIPATATTLGTVQLPTGATSTTLGTAATKAAVGTVGNPNVPTEPSTAIAAGHAIAADGSGGIVDGFDPTKNGYFQCQEETSPGGADVYPTLISGVIAYTCQGGAPGWINSAGTFTPFAAVASVTAAQTTATSAYTAATAAQTAATAAQTAATAAQATAAAAATPASVTTAATAAQTTAIAASQPRVTYTAAGQAAVSSGAGTSAAPQYVLVTNGVAPTGPNQSIASYGGVFQPRVPQIVSGLNIADYGDSTIAFVGPQLSADAFMNELVSTVGVGTSNLRAYPGQLSGDVLDNQIYRCSTLHAGTVYANPSMGTVNFVDDGVNDSRQSYSGNATAQQDFMRNKWSEFLTLQVPTAEMQKPFTNAVVAAGTTSANYNCTSWPELALTSVNATATFSITTTVPNQPIYLESTAVASDTGLWSLYMDGTGTPGSGTLLTDTISGLSSISNATFSGTIYQTTPGTFTTIPVASRFLVPTPGTHTFAMTVTTVGTSGAGFYWAGTIPSVPNQYMAPTVAAFGTIPQQANANAVNSAAYDAVTHAVSTAMYQDGFNTTFIDIRTPILANLATAMSSTDGATSQGLTLTDITTTAGTTLVCSANHYFTLGDINVGGGNGTGTYTGKVMYVEAAMTGGVTNYTYIASLQGGTSPNHCVNVATANNLAISGTGTVYFGAIGEIYPASTSPGLHPNTWGDVLIYRALTAALQPVSNALTLPGVTSTLPNFLVNLPNGGLFNINNSALLVNTMTGARQNPEQCVYNNNGNSDLYEDCDTMLYDTANSQYMFARVSNNAEIAECPSTPMTNLALSNCTAKFAANNTVGETFLRPVNMNTTLTPVTCSTSGTATFSQPFAGATDKKVVIVENACIGTASYTFPIAFTYAPGAYGSLTSTATSISTTTVTVTGAASPGSTGSVMLESY